jgi:hypothetical protein
VGYAQDDLKDAVAEQIACGVATGEPCELSVTLDRGSWYLQAMTLGGQGVIIFCSLGLSKARVRRVLCGVWCVVCVCVCWCVACRLTRMDYVLWRRNRICSGVCC